MKRRNDQDKNDSAHKAAKSTVQPFIKPYSLNWPCLTASEKSETCIDLLQAMQAAMDVINFVEVSFVDMSCIYMCVDLNILMTSMDKVTKVCNKVFKNSNIAKIYQKEQFRDS